jgi:hypothetical protein
MSRPRRYKLSQISVSRVFSAAKVRIKDVPHTISWGFELLAHENRNRIARYHGLHTGERCFIVANGPSLTRTNLDLLSNEKTFGLNRIYLNFSKSAFRPTYYAAFNELILEQFSAEISSLNMPKFLNWNRRSCFDSRDPKVVFLKSNMVLHDFFQPDLTNPFVVGATVTFAAIQIAYYMGFQKVILVGLDHKYSESGTPNQTEMRSTARDESHFHPNYFPKGVRWQLPDLLRSEYDFQIARDAFESDGREILDATVDGQCPSFKKVEYLSLFDKETVPASNLKTA